jgi:hypothetical protein
MRVFNDFSLSLARQAKKSFHILHHHQIQPLKSMPQYDWLGCSAIADHAASRRWLGFLGVICYMTTPPPTTAKPATVTRAIWLLCISLGILVVATLWLAFHNPIASQPGFFSLLIMAWLTHKTNQGRNWARITFLVLYIVGTLISIPAFFMVPQSIVNVGIFIIQAVLQLAALILLFNQDARPWFQETSSQPTKSDETDHNA